MLSDHLVTDLRSALKDPGPVLCLTGAGISAESGIPTFRGPEGYWQAGSRNYRPMELATWSAFQSVPADVWGWYLFRRAVCRAARPNAAHEALVRLEGALAERFRLITQNVDGLHPRAGSRRERTYFIHGDIDRMRCAAACTRDLEPLPEALGETWEKSRLPTVEELGHLSCARCGASMRPHVLWFDEYYDEDWFRFESSMRAASEASLLIVVGTSGATNLPTRVVHMAAGRGIPLVIVDTEPTVFSRVALDSPRGHHLEGRAADVVPALVDVIVTEVTQ